MLIAEAVILLEGHYNGIVVKILAVGVIDQIQPSGLYLPPKYFLAGHCIRYWRYN